MAVKLSWREILSLLDLPDSGEDYGGASPAEFPPAELVWGDGDAANLFDEFWVDVSRDIAATTNDDIDLQSLTGGPRGRAVSFDKIKGIAIDAVTGTLEIGTSTPPTNVWTGLSASGDVIQVPEGAKYRLFIPAAAGLAVSGTDKVLRIRNPGGSTATYRIALLGVKS